MNWVLPILTAWAMCAAFVAFGFPIGRKPIIKKIETIEDTEGNLHYKIDLGRRRGLLREWYWRLDAERKGVSAVTGEMSLGPMVLDVPHLNVVIGGSATGGPYPTRDEALADALRNLETLR